MKEFERKRLWRSVLRQTGRDPERVGYWLRQHCRAERLPPARLARLLGLRMEGLILLSLCLTPREDSFREDLAVICARTGADPLVLAQILRQQQALARWTEQSPSSQGWLMAASDVVLPNEDEKPTPPDQRVP
jgi:hypothetical protein